MVEQVNVAAVDLGASSGRVIHATVSARGARLQEMHRFANDAVAIGRTLHWNILGLYRGALEGVRAAHEVNGGLDCIGVDSWAVDYGLLTADGTLLGNPVHYRDGRTADVAKALVSALGFGRFYDATGIQFQAFNTVFQLSAEARGHLLDSAAHVALIPDLVSFWLTGELGTELTNASTTALLDPRTLDWQRDLAGAVGVDLGLFAPLRRPGTVLGPLRKNVAESAGVIGGRRLVATVPSHDTAAAVAAIPAHEQQFGFVATGTWALVGLNLSAPVLSDRARDTNFTNEVAADGSIRFLRNVTGFWLLQECQRHWRAEGTDADSAHLAAAAAHVPALHSVIDVQDASLVAPGDMPARIIERARTRSGARINSPAEITRCILDSMALAVRAAVADAAGVSGFDPPVLHLVGGGVHNTLFCQLVADACARPVLAGPSEAAAWGNALYQAVALGVIDAQDIRTIVAASEAVHRYEPATGAAGVGYRSDWDEASRRLEQMASA